MDGDEVLVAVRNPRELGQLGRFLHQTLDGPNVALALFLRYVAPVNGMLRSCSQITTQPAMGRTYHSLRISSMALVHVVDLATTASMLGRPFFYRSSTGSATTKWPSRRSQGIACSAGRTMVATMDLHGYGALRQYHMPQDAASVTPESRFSPLR